MGRAVEIRNLWFQYPGRTEPTLKNIDLLVEEGEFVLITGPTGSGKSTLLSCINGLIPAESGGMLKGEVKVLGHPATKGPSQLFPEVATVLQNPASQLVSGEVGAEVAFALENLCLPPGEIRARVKEALEMVGLEGRAGSSTEALSGGQKQRLAIAAALALRPRILLMDEPLSQLDPEGVRQILEVMSRVIKAMGMTVIVVEHRWDNLLSMATRMVHVREGRILFQGRPKEKGVHGEVERESSLWAGWDDNPDTEPPPGRVLISIEGLGFSYPEAESPALDDINLTFFQGERVALAGPNGSGKSTLLSLLAGIQRPTRGRIRFHFGTRSCELPVSMLLQDPDLMLFQFSVEEELAFAPLNLRLSREKVQERIHGALSLLELKNHVQETPFSLSRGQRLRVALASILTGRPRVLLLDEPTTGQDRDQVRKFIKSLEGIADLLIFSTHDHGFAQELSSRIIFMEQGKVTAIKRPCPH